MTALTDGFEALRAALKHVSGVRGCVLGERVIDPPATILAPPRLEWSLHGQVPTEATFEVALVVAMGDRTTTQLLTLLPRVIAAIDAVPDAVVRSATAGIYPAAPKDLPAYLISVDFAV